MKRPKRKPILLRRGANVTPTEGADDSPLGRGEMLTEGNSRVDEEKRRHGERMNLGEEAPAPEFDEIVPPDNAFREATRENSTLEP